MTTLNELEKLAAEAFQRGAECETHLGYTADKAGTYVVKIKNKDLTKMVELLRELGARLDVANEIIKGEYPVEEWLDYGVDENTAVLEKLKEWME